MRRVRVDLWFRAMLVLCVMHACAAPSTDREGTTTAAGAPRWSEWDRVKIAAAQVSIHTTTTVEEMVSFIDRAGEDGAQLIVLGEYILGEFPSDDPLEADAAGRVSEAARRNEIYVIVGGWEEFEPGAYAARQPRAFANTALVFDREGRVIGRYRKAHGAVGGVSRFCWPPLATDHEWLMLEGDTFPTFQLDFARVGIMTCYDGFFPECAGCLSLGGAEIICWINGRAGPVEPWLVQAAMFTNYCAMVSTNLAPGSGTMIGTWPATLLAHITEPGLHYISAEIDLKTLREYRANSRTFHQRKPAIYGALVEAHEPWTVYEPFGHVEPPVPPTPVRDDAP
jgi:predicted amidohydrolase